MQIRRQLIGALRADEQAMCGGRRCNWWVVLAKDNSKYFMSFQWRTSGNRASTLSIKGWSVMYRIFNRISKVKANRYQKACACKRTGVACDN